MDVQPQDGMQMNDMGQVPPMDMAGGNAEQSQFDTNFDAGVEADEETDPKKYIQQLTGKLSQSLRKFNDDNGQPDADLNKYVAGMIVKQAIEGLSQDDADEILDKVKSDGDFEEEPMQQQEPQQDGNAADVPPMGAQQPNESKSRKGRSISEMTNGILDSDDEDDGQKQYLQNKKKGGFRQKPFTSPNFSR